MEAVNDFEDDSTVFQAWLLEKGIQMSPKIALRDLRAYKKGRGIVALEDIEDDEVLFTVPRSSVLSVGSAVGGSSLQNSPNLQERLLSMPPWLGLTTLILHEISIETSDWAPYLAVILRQQLGSLIFWSQAELSELQASAVVAKIRKADAENIFNQQVIPLFSSDLNISSCHQIASIIMAYAFDIPETNGSNALENESDDNEDDVLISDEDDDVVTTLSMVPLADMLNADADKNNARLICDNDDLEMRSIIPIKRGEEILNDYGQLPRSDLLRRYGYITERYTSYDVVEISMSLIISALQPGACQLPELEFLQVKQEGLKRVVELGEREMVYSESYDLTHSGADGRTIPDELLAMLYLFLLQEEAFDMILTSHTSLPSRSKLSTELVGQTLAAILQLREKEYATTLEEDEHLLRLKNCSPRNTMAIEVRLGEKRILRNAIQEAGSFSGSNKYMSKSLLSEKSSNKRKRLVQQVERQDKRGRR